MTGIKRLTPPQSRKVNSLIKKECCNCDNGHCILLDDGEECVCPQLISYSLLCKWFQTAVLPLDKLLYAELFKTEDKKRCTECGASFASTSNSVKYCPDCRKRITRRQAAGKKSLDLRGFQCLKMTRQGFYTLSPKNDVLLRNRYQKRTYIKQGADSLLLAVCALFFYFIRAVLLYPLFGFPIGYTALHSLPL